MSQKMAFFIATAMKTSNLTEMGNVYFAAAAH
jgi:Na+-translocating ferredoxin:NAD+ oxidoreductase RnfD subunit